MNIATNERLDRSEQDKKQDLKLAQQEKLKLAKERDLLSMHGKLVAMETLVRSDVFRLGKKLKTLTGILREDVMTQAGKEGEAASREILKTAIKTSTQFTEQEAKEMIEELDIMGKGLDEIGEEWNGKAAATAKTGRVVRCTFPGCLYPWSHEIVSCRARIKVEGSAAAAYAHAQQQAPPVAPPGYAIGYNFVGPAPTSYGVPPPPPGHNVNNYVPFAPGHFQPVGSAAQFGQGAGAAARGSVKRRSRVLSLFMRAKCMHAKGHVEQDKNGFFS